MWPSEAKSYSCSSFSRSKRIGKNKPVLLSVFLNVIAYLMNYLKIEISSCLMPYYRLRSWSGVHIASGIIVVPMQLMIAMFFVNKYNQSLMKDDWQCMRCKMTKCRSQFIPLIWIMSRYSFGWNKTEWAKGKNVIIGEPRPKIVNNKIVAREVMLG